MYCTKCGVELRNDDRFCSRCGQVTGVGRVEMEPERLMLDKENKKIAGVCAGFARLWDIDVTIIRIIWLILAFSTGVGFIAYIVAWIVMPSDTRARSVQPAPQRV
ncbi:MAG TPA: PspC domain-containing protein [Verrucomicrobiae bacterium]|nr:PspC domain-containing protein [Verrucomicrobiae bacterium]